ncbi:MAG: MFS transporter [Dehalococcoidia bacterium]|nr:MFS transporter [Dehalococcoidia bacterium]
MISQQTRIGLHYGYVALALAALTLLSALGFGRWTYSLILPGMKEGMHLTYTQMGLLGTGYMVGYMVAVPLAGIAASRYGSRLVMGGSLLITGLSLLATGASPTFEWALLFQTLTGIASTGAIVPSMAVPGTWVAPEKRGIATGLVNSFLGLSFFVTGPIIPALLASSTDMGWRYSWFLVAAVVLLSGILVAAFLRNYPQDLGLQVLAFNPKLAPKERPTSTLSWGSVYRSGAIWHLSALYAIFGFAYVSYMTFFAAFLREQGGLSETIIGNMWAISGVGVVIGSLVWGSLSDRLGRRASIAAVFFFLAAAIFALTLSRSPLVYTLSTVLFWAAEPGVPVIVAAACGDYVGGRLVPAAVGLTTFFMGIGQAIGPILTGRIADMTSSFDIAFYLTALVALLGLLGSLFLRQPPRALT